MVVPGRSGPPGTDVVRAQPATRIQRTAINFTGIHKSNGDATIRSRKGPRDLVRYLVKVHQVAVGSVLLWTPTPPSGCRSGAARRMPLAGGSIGAFIACEVIPGSYLAPISRLSRVVLLSTKLPVVQSDLRPLMEPTRYKPTRSQT